MEEIGEILHVIHGNRAIARAKIAPKPGVTVYDIRRKPIGQIVDIFGPVKSPYIEIEIKEKDPRKLVNSPIYILYKSKSSRGER